MNGEFAEIMNMDGCQKPLNSQMAEDVCQAYARLQLRAWQGQQMKLLNTTG